MTFTLGPSAMADGYRLDVLDTVGSTNAEALARARAGDRGRLWITSHRQTDGRGRRGSHWQSPEGNLAVSLLLVPDAPAEMAATLGFVAGLALSDALGACAPDVSTLMALDGNDGAEGSRFRLKWPNDVLAGAAKVSGILLEGTAAPSGRQAVVVGIGVNVAHAPADLPYPAASLQGLGADVTAESLLRVLTDAWVARERVWDCGRGFGAIRAAWLKRAAGLGAPVAVRQGNEVLRGIFETIDDDGRLIVMTDEGGRKTISAGDVHFGTAATERG
ncbi:BirA family transcriptional regulator, biotin operon repressor / biotin-[acetyl-CoA-carboxylase] ligase [Faunimonas pinastri]|uniref:biotin--[biotin carboxyl-carrier protein] ligase n=1 Tax=Faunimonas pinastri TaxID=1855383 RepID=A0A1H9J8F1_9HYPH|nr:biotin--[acetyl-CoA-carboxylase] ligase [Faunimonas pinastri]SEQ83063.1 BirA family transcriptional regulator, biotin operon repressor / biotin-[acetyl-CoA-carboxylase] ligase [Faunimonas pinastri]